MSLQTKLDKNKKCHTCYLKKSHSNYEFKDLEYVSNNTMQAPEPCLLKIKGPTKNSNALKFV